MKRIAHLCLLALTLAGACRGQGVPPPFATSQLQLPVNTTIQQATGSVALVGNPGPQQYFYWIVSNYQVGSSSPYGPIPAPNSPNVLSGSNYNLITPNYKISPAPVSVDLLRTTTPAPPSGTCTCAVATGVASGSIADQSNSLSSYTVTAVNLNSLGLTLANEVVGLNQTHPIIRQNGALLVDLAGAGSGTITNVIAGSGLTGGGALGAVTINLGPCPNGQTQVSNGAGYSCGATGGSSVTLSTNGTNNASQSVLNFINSAAVNGQTITATNTSGGTVQLGSSWSNFGAYNVYGNCTASPAQPGACPITAAMLPALSALSGVLVLTQTPLTTSSDLMTVFGGNLVRLGLGGSGTFLGNCSGTLGYCAPPGGGNVTGPISSTVNFLPLYSNTTGSLLGQSSISDNGTSISSTEPATFQSISVTGPGAGGWSSLQGAIPQPIPNSIVANGAPNTVTKAYFQYWPGAPGTGVFYGTPSTDAVLGTPVLSGGAVSSVGVTSGGTYGETPACTISGNGAGALCHFNMSGSAISAVVIDAGGAGYTSASASASPEEAVSTIADNGVTGQVLESVNGAAPGYFSPGLPGRLVSGTSDTVLCDSATAIRDRTGSIQYTSASAVAVTLPQAGSSGCGSNFYFDVLVTGAGIVTITPTTSTITTANGYSAVIAQTSLSLPKGSQCRISSPDNVNYVARCGGASQLPNSALANLSGNGVNLATALASLTTGAANDAATLDGSGNLQDSKVVITPPATSATLTILNGKTLTVNNTITLSSNADGNTIGNTNALTSNAVLAGAGGGQYKAATGLSVGASGQLSTYFGLTTTAVGVSPILANIHTTGLTAAVATATLCGSGATACGNAGQYKIEWTFTGGGTACSNVTAGSVTFLLTWVDSTGTTHSAVSEQMMAQTGAATTAMQSTFPFQTALANEGASGEVTITSNGSAAIQYATGYTACTTGTGTYSLDIVAKRLQ